MQHSVIAEATCILFRVFLVCCVIIFAFFLLLLQWEPLLELVNAKTQPLDGVLVGLRILLQVDHIMDTLIHLLLLLNYILYFEIGLILTHGEVHGRRFSLLFLLLLLMIWWWVGRLLVMLLLVRLLEHLGIQLDKLIRRLFFTLHCDQLILLKIELKLLLSEGLFQYISFQFMVLYQVSQLLIKPRSDTL